MPINLFSLSSRLSGDDVLVSVGPGAGSESRFSSGLLVLTHVPAASVSAPQSNGQKWKVCMFHASVKVPDGVRLPNELVTTMAGFGVKTAAVIKNTVFLTVKPIGQMAPQEQFELVRDFLQGGGLLHSRM